MVARPSRTSETSVEVPPHVEAQRVAMTGEPGHERGAGHPPGRSESMVWAGESLALAMLIKPPSDAHDVHRRAEIDSAELVVEALQVAPHARAHVGVHHRHQGALVLAELRQDLSEERETGTSAPVSSTSALSRCSWASLA